MPSPDYSIVFSNKTQTPSNFDNKKEANTNIENKEETNTVGREKWGGAIQGQESTTVGYKISYKDILYSTGSGKYLIVTLNGV